MLTATKLMTTFTCVDKKVMFLTGSHQQLEHVSLKRYKNITDDYTSIQVMDHVSLNKTVPNRPMRFGEICSGSLPRYGREYDACFGVATCAMSNLQGMIAKRITLGLLVDIFHFPAHNQPHPTD